MLTNHCCLIPVRCGSPTKTFRLIFFPADDLNCCGKDHTYREAFTSGLGAAVERYAEDRVDHAAIIYARRAKITLDKPLTDDAAKLR